MCRNEDRTMEMQLKKKLEEMNKWKHFLEAALLIIMYPIRWTRQAEGIA